MNGLRMELLVLSALTAAALATNVEQCPGRQFSELSARTHLTPCKRPPCKLKVGTSAQITLEFTPEKDVGSLKNEVNADVLGLPLPFPGVDGASVCDKIYLGDSPDIKAECPLKAGTKYIYKDSFPILPIYPSISTRIHWALKSGKRDVICFEVNAKIVR